VHLVGCTMGTQILSCDTVVANERYELSRPCPVCCCQSYLLTYLFT